MADLLELVKEYADKCNERIVVADDGYGDCLRVYSLSTDGARLFADIGAALTSRPCVRSVVDVTDYWVYDVTEGRLVYGDLPVATES